MRRFTTLCMILATSFSIMANDTKKEEFDSKKYIRIKAGGSLPGTLESDIDTLDTGIGMELMVEGVYRATENLEVASGIGFQGHGNMDTSYGTQNSFYSVPLYISVKRNFFSLPIYAKGLGGLSLNMETDDFDYKYANGLSSVEYEHGYYWAAGAGIELGRIEVEALYSENKISFNYQESGEEKNSGKIVDKRITINLSYAFELK